MRYLLPAVLAAFMVSGCASTQCQHRDAQAEPQPAVKASEEVPLLADIPILGPLFELDAEPKPAQPQPAGKEVAAEVPLLADIPILGFMFKRADPDKEDSDK